MESLRAFIIQRLTVAANDIFEAVEKVVAECQEDVERTKEEKARVQRLDLVFKPEIKREPQSHGSEVEVILGQENPEPTPATEEQQELPGQDPVLTFPCVRTDFDQVPPQPTHLYQTQTVENRQRTSWDSQHSHAAQIKPEPDRESYGGPGQDLPSLPFPVNPPDGTVRVESNGPVHFVAQHLNPSRTQSLSTQVKQFQCKECGKHFNCKGILNRHIMIHTGAKPFKCKECTKCFNRKSVLNRHMIVHTGARPFKCEECGRSFNRETHLSRHLRIHTRGKNLAWPNQLPNAVESGNSPFIFDFQDALSPGADHNGPANWT